MRKILLLSIIIIPFIAAAQDTSMVKISEKLSVKPGQVYLDNKLIEDLGIYLDSTNIKSVRQIRGKDSATSTKSLTAVLINRKINNDIISLYDIRIKKENSKDLNLQFIVDGVLITDIPSVMFETSAIKNIEILSTSDAEIISGKKPATTVVITTAGWKIKGGFHNN